MICNKCGKDQDCNYIVLVTGKTQDIQTSYSGENRVAKITYGEFEPMYYYICQDCWREHERKDDTNNLILFSVTFAIGILLIILGAVLKEDIKDMCSGIGYFSGLVGLVGTLITGITRFRTNYAALDINTVDKKKLFTTFNDEIAKHVYKARGDVQFWEQQNWQDRMDKKPNITLDTRRSKP
jgi:hypothetical protein